MQLRSAAHSPWRLAWLACLPLAVGCALGNASRQAASKAELAARAPSEKLRLRDKPAAASETPTAPHDSAAPTRLPPVTLASHEAPNAPTVKSARASWQKGNFPQPRPNIGKLPEELPRPNLLPADREDWSLSQRLKIPAELPGATAPPLNIPPADLVQPEARTDLIDQLFPDLKRVKPLAAPPPEGRAPAMTLIELEQIALSRNPALAQAEQNVSVATGQAIQAGVYPNPVLGYEGDTVGSGGTPNYQGVFATQVIKTAGKLGLARAAANMDVMNAQLDARKARFELLSQVKAKYFAVLVAQENLRISDALARFTNEAYRVQVDRLKGGESTSYEPAQLRSQAVQARAALFQAQNRYISAWKQLAATLGTPDLPPARIDEPADMATPWLNFDDILQRTLNSNTDVQAARNLETQARLQLRLAEVTPIPDVNVYGAFQRDFTTPGTPRTTYNLQVGVPLPLFDRNRGNILSAQGNLRKAAEQLRLVSNDLTGKLADAFERFETSRVQAQFYRDQILPDLARAYRGVYERHQQEPEQVGFGDIIVAQQNLAAAIGTYISSLSDQWTALTDIIRLLQAENLDELNARLPPSAPPADLPPQKP